MLKLSNKLAPQPRVTIRSRGESVTFCCFRAICYRPTRERGQGTIAEEAAQALENIRAIVEAAEAPSRPSCNARYISDNRHWGLSESIYGAFFSEYPYDPPALCAGQEMLRMVAALEIQAIAFLNSS